MIGLLFLGGVFKIDKSLAPISENCKVLGIGVAVIDKISTFSFFSFILSFTLTPNFCSSSIIRSPRSLKFILSFDIE